MKTHGIDSTVCQVVHISGMAHGMYSLELEFAAVLHRHKVGNASSA